MSNTFGEMLPYLLSPENQVADGGRRFSYEHDKQLHVSPFFSLDQGYRWWFTEPGDEVSVRIDVAEDGERPFWATLHGPPRGADERVARAHRSSATR